MGLGRDRWAVLDDDEVYRYDLGRRWDRTRPTLGWVMLNPSVGDALTDDHTLSRCMFYARREGYGGIVVRNLFAYRTPQPKVLAAARANGQDIVGPHNNQWLMDLAAGNGPRPDAIVCAWGSGASLPRGVHSDRVAIVAGILTRGSARPMLLTLGDRPNHPARLRNDQPLQAFTP